MYSNFHKSTLCFNEVTMIVFYFYFAVLLIFSGLVPLHNACSYGHYEVTELLLKVRTEKVLVGVVYFNV